VDRREGIGMSTVEEVVARVFGAEPGSIDGASSPETVEGWDSMGHLNLVAALEHDFDVSLDLSDVMEMVCVKRIREILLDYGVQA
jgi:acyl carrier protein